RIPELEIIEREVRGVFLRYERRDGEPPDERARAGHHMETERVARARGEAEDDDGLDLAVMRLQVVEVLAADQALESWYVRVQVRHTSSSTMRLAIWCRADSSVRDRKRVG